MTYRERPCANCGSAFRAWSTIGKYCSRECYYAVVGHRPAMLEVACANCGTPYRRTRAVIARNKRTFCSQSCSTTYYSGDRSSMFRGGEAHRRGPGWIVNRRAARLRDGVCRFCGKTPEENKQALSVDHIIPWRLFVSEELANSLDNLVSLCRACHARKSSGSERQYMVGDVIAFGRYLDAIGADLTVIAKLEKQLARLYP